MTLPRKLMIDGEQTVTTTRTHVKVLFIPVIILLAVAAAGSFLATRIGNEANGVPRWVVIGVAVVLATWGAVLPFVRWYLWTYTLTNKRIVEQKGILTRTGRVIPLSRINDVAFEKNLNDRILGCGTLVIHDASEQAGLELRDIPHIEDLHRTVTGLVDQAHRTSDESI
jgi:membrane protein YdbS with pleckstrin-like domain